MTAADAAPTLAATRAGGSCTAGAHTLSPPGSRLYPETGNGGYTSVHTSVSLVYDAASNRFLSGNHVTLTDRATQCLTSFSLDFERRSVNTRPAGHDRHLGLGERRPPRSRSSSRPTPATRTGRTTLTPAHQASELNPVGGRRTTRSRPPAPPS